VPPCRPNAPPASWSAVTCGAASPRSSRTSRCTVPLADAHPGIVAVSALYVDGEGLVAALDDAGFAVHSGSSCVSTSGEPSHVLVAMGALTHGHVRVSIGPETTIADADALLAAFAEAVTTSRAAAGMRARPAGR
jgi:cysteine desulfurase